MGRDQEDGGRYIFLDYLRACAAWLVVWDHLAATMPGWVGKVFGPAAWVRNNVAAPLGIIQDFGWFGVALFFLISGFIISDRARVEGVREFVVRRIFRIYPMLVLAVLLSAFLLHPKAKVTPADLALNVTLANYLIAPQVVLLGVAWTLIIEVVFYAVTALTQFARTSPHRIAVNLAVVVATLLCRGRLGDNFALFSVTASYLPVLIMGQIVYWWLAKRELSAAWAIAYLLAAYGVFLWSLRAIHPGFLPATNSYLISVAYALLLFVALMPMRLRASRVVRFLSNTSYSMYLLHGIVGQLVIGALATRVPISVAILIAAVGSLAAAFVTYRLVEIPSQHLARHLSRHWRASTPPPTALRAQGLEP